MTTTSTSTEIPLLKRINALKTPAKELLRNLYDAWSEAIEIPNSLLPANLRSETGKGKTAKDILHPKLTPLQMKRLEAEEREIEKGLRLDEYCKDIENGRELRYHEDEERLHRNQITFANLIGLEFED